MPRLYPVLFALCVPLVFLHADYQPSFTVSLGGSDATLYLSDLAVLAIGARIGAVAGIRLASPPLSRRAARFRVSSAVFLAFVLAGRPGRRGDDRRLPARGQPAHHREADRVRTARARGAARDPRRPPGLHAAARRAHRVEHRRDVRSAPAIPRRAERVRGPPPRAARALVSRHHDFAALSGASLALALAAIALGRSWPFGRVLPIVAGIAGGSASSSRARAPGRSASFSRPCSRPCSSASAAALAASTRGAGRRRGGRLPPVSSSSAGTTSTSSSAGSASSRPRDDEPGRPELCPAHGAALHRLEDLPRPPDRRRRLAGLLPAFELRALPRRRASPLSRNRPGLPRPRPRIRRAERLGTGGRGSRRCRVRPAGAPLGSAQACVRGPPDEPRAAWSSGCSWGRGRERAGAGRRNPARRARLALGRARGGRRSQACEPDLRTGPRRRRDRRGPAPHTTLLAAVRWIRRRHVSRTRSRAVPPAGRGLRRKPYYPFFAQYVSEYVGWTPSTRTPS